MAEIDYNPNTAHPVYLKDRQGNMKPALIIHAQERDWSLNKVIQKALREYYEKYGLSKLVE